MPPYHAWLAGRLAAGGVVPREQRLDTVVEAFAGGAGLTLSWGSARAARDLARTTSV